MKDLQRIKTAVEDLFGYEIEFNTQKPRLTKPRGLYYDLARIFTNKSYRVIGDFFGGVNHATVMHGVKNSAQFHNSDKKYRIAS